MSSFAAALGRALEVIEREAEIPGLAEQARPLAEAGVGALPALAVSLMLPNEALLGLKLLKTVSEARKGKAHDGAPRTWREYFDARAAQQAQEGETA